MLAFKSLHFQTILLALAGGLVLVFHASGRMTCQALHLEWHGTLSEKLPHTLTAPPVPHGHLTPSRPTAKAQALVYQGVDMPMRDIHVVKSPFFHRSPEHALQLFIRHVNPKLTPLERQQLAQHILNNSSQFQVDYRLIASIVATESSFRSNALSVTGAMGLGQLKSQTATWLGVKEPFQVQDNLQGTTRYLQYLLTRFHAELDPALASYFEGPTKVSQTGISPKGIAYLQKVNAHLQTLKQYHQPWRISQP
ncbi:MAG: lytic transglycosylase domain-containing protein [Vampirovibrionales bacterium]